MGKAYYIENGTVRAVRKIYVGVNNKARIIRKGYVGVNGVARLIFGLDLVPIPTIAGTYTYDGTEQTANIVNYNENFMTRTGIYKATNAGTYQVTFTLTHEDSAWADGSSDPITLSWTINKKALTKPTVSGTYTYNGQTQTLALSGFDSNTMVKGGTYSAINAGNYTATINLANTNNYKWSNSEDGNPINLPWTINKKILTPPTVTSSTSYTYDGTQRTLSFSGFDSNTMSKSGTHSATDAGEYTAWIDIIQPNNYEWSTVITEYVTYHWKINPATGWVKVDGKTNYNMGAIDSGAKATITGSSTYWGDYYADTTDSNLNVIVQNTYYPSGNKIELIVYIIESISGGITSATITVTMRGGNYTTATATVSLSYGGFEG